MLSKRLIITPFQLISTHFFSISVLALLYFGWLRRHDNYLSAETGAGYILGIVGGSLMLVLLLYPLSKRIKLMTRWIPIRYWFGIHMFLGVIGPVMILFHSNFQLGSKNSSIAFISMLLVAGSGLVGRYIYTHIHHGLYGTRISIKELKQDTENNHSELLRLCAMDEKLNKQLMKMEETALKPYTGLMTSLLHVIYLAVNAPRLKRNILRTLKKTPTRTAKTKHQFTKKLSPNQLNAIPLRCAKLQHSECTNVFSLYGTYFISRYFS